MDLPKRYLDEMKEIVPSFPEFLRSYDEPPVKAFKVNTLKIDDDTLLNAMGEHCPVPFAAHAYYADERKWGRHPFHHAGLMYFQEPSAMAAINAYDITADLALDMCAAPGGKAIWLAEKVGRLVANEVNPSRAAVLKGNIERMGCTNVAVTNHFPTDFEPLGEIFDLVLVDAPCSGEGMFRKDETAIGEWSEEHSKSCALRQIAILESADKVLKRGGMLIYSTCTFSKRENEDVVNDFLSRRDYSLVMPKSEAEAQTVFLTDKHMRRFYPHLAKGEGQFFAAMVKNDGGINERKKAIKFASNKAVDAFLDSTTGGMKYCGVNDIFYVPALDFELPLSKIVSGGVRIGKIEKAFKPDHCFFSAFGKKMFCFEPSEMQLLKFLHGEELEGEHIGYGAVTVLSAPLGGFKGVDGRYKNLYPKGLRI